jgi:hypothetical protein
MNTSQTYLKLAAPKVAFVGPFYTQVRRDSIMTQLKELGVSSEVVDVAGKPLFDVSDLRKVVEFVKQ